jgi:hypothetical protein
MKRAITKLSMVAILLIAADVTAQTKPDLSGRWTNEAATNEGAGRGDERLGSPGSGWGSTIAIAQDASRLTVEYAFFGRGDMQPPLKFVYALDGTETKNSVMMGRGIQMQPSKTTWEGDKLVITTTHSFTHPETGQLLTSEVKQTLALESPTSLVVETTRNGVLGGPSSTTRTVYRKL